MEMDDDNSQMFNVDHSKEVPVRNMHFFNEKTEIIKPGQRHKVIYGPMEKQQKPLYEIVAPYLHKFAETTAVYAKEAGSYTYEALKTGAIWVYNRFVDSVIPYAVENLPKIIFVTKKKEKPLNIHSNDFQVIGVQEEEFNSIYERGQGKEKGKTRVVIPLGTQNDKHFQEYLKKENYEFDYDFPIDQESEEYIQAKKSFIMPSESFETVCQQVKQSHAQLQLEKPLIRKKKAYKLQNCFIFEFQGENTVEYDLDILDSIQKCKDAEPGYIVSPEQTLRMSMKSQKSEDLDPIGRLVQGKQEEIPYVQEEQEFQEKKKKIDNTRKVRVDIHQTPPSGETPLLEN